jgi:hypothetical protein
MLHCTEDCSVSLERPVPVNDLVLALVELKEALYALEVIVPVLLVRQEVIHRPEIQSYMLYNETRPYMLYIHCNENPLYVFLFWELRGFSLNFHIHVSVSDLYIPRIGPHIFPEAA